MKTAPPRPRATEYICTKGCGASKAKRVSKSGVQNRNKIAVMNPRTPVAMAPPNIPRAATTLETEEMSILRCDKQQITCLAFFVSSAMCPEASNPVRVPAVKRLGNMASNKRRKSHFKSKHTTTRSNSKQAEHPFHYLCNDVNIQDKGQKRGH